MGATNERLDFEKDSHLRSLFDSIDEGVIIWDSGRRIIYANKAADRITGLVHNPGSLLPPEGSATNRGPVGPILNREPVYRAFDGENVHREEMQYLDPHGKHKWLTVSAKRVTDTAGNLSYVISSLRDISIRKGRENKLEFMVESAKILQFDIGFKERLIQKAKLTVPTLADCCIVDVLDEGGSLERVATVHSDPARSAALEQYDKRYPRDDDRPGSVRTVIRTQTPLFIPIVSDESLARVATSPQHLADMRALNFRSVMIVPIVSHGKGVGAMTLAYSDSGRTFDESDLEFFQEFCYHLSVVFDNAHLIDEIQKRDKSKDIFLAALSHELRNPLAPIKSSLELLKLRDTPRDIREELDIVEHQFDHMAKLLNDLLDVTRFTQDRISLSAKPIDLRRLIERSVRATDGVIRQADITLHMAYPSTPLSVNADETRLEQAVSNLLSNAVKFTPAGGSIWVDIERDGDFVLIRVRDDGTGIEPEDLPNIFDMYYQGNNKGTINSGLGIGLLLVQRIITLHGGTVEARSEGRDSGSEFIIRLPLANVSITETMTRPFNSVVRNLRVLVVDDNAPAADSLVRLLNKLGAHAQAVYSGHEALGCEQLATVDLFLLDVGMPHMNGYELVAALRSKGISAPIVALTGYGLSDDKQRAYDAGFTAHLTKPIGLAELNIMFDQVLLSA